MTVSAPVRFRPWPPARVESRKANTSSLLLNRSTVARRVSTAEFGGRRERRGKAGRVEPRQALMKS